MSKYKNDPTDYWRVSSDYCVVDNRSALKIGLNESIVLRTLYELCRTKKQNDGISWWQGKQQYWLIKFPWLSEKTLQRVFAKLEKLKLIEIRVDRKTGNHYRPVQEQIEQMLNDDDFRVELIDTINDTASGQNVLMSGQIDLTLLSLGSSPLSVPLSDSLPAVKTAGFQEPLVEVLEQLREPKQEKQKTAGAQIFEAYKDAYLQRYKIEPLRNAKTYSICSQIAKQLPLDEALALVHFYVQQNVSYYLQRSHPIQLALGDLQALRTNMLKNKAMSSREAYLADKQQAQKNVLDEYLENREQIQQMFKL